MSNPVPVPQCTHTKTNGEVCGSPAVSGTEFCYHHSAMKTALGKVQPQGKAAYGEVAPIPFLFPEDRASMQINFFLLLQVFNEQRIDARTYRLMLSLLKAMAKNLGKTGSLVDNPTTEGAPSLTNAKRVARVGKNETSDQEAASKEAISEKSVSKADGLESLLDLKASAAIAPESCFSTKPQNRAKDVDWFRVSTLGLAKQGLNGAARMPTR